MKLEKSQKRRLFLETQKTDLKKVFKKKRRSSSDEEKYHKATKQYFGGICRIDEQV